MRQTFLQLETIKKESHDNEDRNVVSTAKQRLHRIVSIASMFIDLINVINIAYKQSQTF